jgi:hypothetical protein
VPESLDRTTILNPPPVLSKKPENPPCYAISGHLMPLSPPYYMGRFSNGPVTVEYLANSLRVGAPVRDLQTWNRVRVGLPVI